MFSLSAMAADFNQTQRLANQGNARAQRDLGTMYEYGNGISKDYAKALEWYKKFSSLGYIIPKFKIAAMYYQYKGVRQDYTEALKVYRPLAEKGYSSAQFNLGLAYYEGKGVRQDKAEAKE